jgi:7-cyano-7-deazaguanine synthase
MHGAVVLTSGGQDSTTSLAWAIEQFGNENIRTISFDYGQRHEVELECAQRVCEILEVPRPMIVPVPAFRLFAGAALTNPDIEVELQASATSDNQFAHDHGLPSTFVPGRNMVFLALAAGYGAQQGIYDLVTGVCEADAAGYPDCRAQFIKRARQALSEALDDQVTIHTPLIAINKGQTWQLAHDLGVLDVIINETHTCYHGVHDEDHKFHWGYGCGTCPACIERAKGYQEFIGVPAA